MKYFNIMAVIFSCCIGLSSCEKQPCGCAPGPSQILYIDLIDSNEVSLFNQHNFDTNAVREYRMVNGNLEVMYNSASLNPYGIQWEYVDGNAHLMYAHWPKNRETLIDTQYYSFYENDIDTFISYYEDRKFHLLFNNSLYVTDTQRVLSIRKY